MPRRLQAIEIAEGALLADIAIVVQIIGAYVPVGGGMLHSLNFVVFAVIVLRRGLYTGVMSLCVATFVIMIILGPHSVVSMFVQAVAGLFLGFCMHHRVRHSLLLFLGVTFGALTIYGLTFALLLALGESLATFVQQLHLTYQHLISGITFVMTKAHLLAWWRQGPYSFVSSIAVWGFANWALAYFLVLWLVLVMPVTGVYAMTNFFVRVLGYDVRPFPDGWIHRRLERTRRHLIKVAIKRGIIKRQGVHA